MTAARAGAMQTRTLQPFAAEDAGASVDCSSTLLGGVTRAILRNGASPLLVHTCETARKPLSKRSLKGTGLMFRLRTILLMWLARRAWRLLISAYRRRQRRRLRTA
jgi:hypothetical protein